jgi:hypothetical protein
MWYTLAFALQLRTKRGKPDLSSRRFWLAAVLLQMRLLCWTLSIILVGGGLYYSISKIRSHFIFEWHGLGVGVDARLAGPLEGVGVYHWRAAIAQKETWVVTLKWINQLEAAINYRFIVCQILSFLYRASFQRMKWKTNRCHYFNFIHISTDLYMFWAHRPILRRIHTAVPTIIGSATEPMIVWTAVWSLLKMGLWARNM